MDQRRFHLKFSLPASFLKNHAQGLPPLISSLINKHSVFLVKTSRFIIFQDFDTLSQQFLDMTSSQLPLPSFEAVPEHFPESNCQPWRAPHLRQVHMKGVGPLNPGNESVLLVWPDIHLRFDTTSQSLF